MLAEIIYLLMYYGHYNPYDDESPTETNGTAKEMSPSVSF
jgi:hypothetical protein